MCKRCALLGPTCCQLSLGNEENCFPLSQAEKERIQTEVNSSGGFAMQENTEAFIGNMCQLFPDEAEQVRALFKPRKFHFRLAVDNDGSCKFLGPRGCVIPEEARPYYCRLFPVWMSGDRVTFFNTLTCLARKEALNQKKLLESVHTTSTKVRDLMGRLRLVWGLPPRPGMKRVKKTF
ncbi:MAG: zinc/iron-chelating domain-containing protein [Proteobacteria bacterium]|nr:zinc/iron-chelating domain-containing protein [Pseudomonadota bacterium]MBU1611265.1 zinc/iron-chelating domain-containing protein [Pseudomonadota bacterium]